MNNSSERLPCSLSHKRWIGKLRESHLCVAERVAVSLWNLSLRNNPIERGFVAKSRTESSSPIFSIKIKHRRTLDATENPCAVSPLTRPARTTETNRGHGVAARVGTTPSRTKCLTGFRWTSPAASIDGIMSSVSTTTTPRKTHPPKPKRSACTGCSLSTCSTGTAAVGPRFRAVV
jgi:hypothetical protein